jgi:hypothetical protein
MVEFRYLHGTVYIFENSKAQRVKVGMTSIGVNDVIARLRDVNDMWLERKVTCQICGKRTVNIGGSVPHHVVSGIGCPGGNALRLEKNVAIAESHLENMKSRFSELSGTEKGSVTRKIKTLEKRIERYRRYNRPVGEWQFRVAFYTEGVAEVELLSHQVLADHLDRAAPFGEVFCCSVSQATEAVEKALSELGLLHSARKESISHCGCPTRLGWQLGCAHGGRSS